jgi:hypothetical protein
MQRILLAEVLSDRETEISQGTKRDVQELSEILWVHGGKDRGVHRSC